MFFADLHIHSKFSRATGKDADLEHMALWGRKKGVTVIGTGDFTHPQWMQELREKLVPAEPGLFRLRDDLERAVGQAFQPDSNGPSALSAQTDPPEIDRQAGKPDLLMQGVTRFLLEVEISTIYKKGDFTRKVHHCIYAPDFDAADKMFARLSRIGNLASDGRPILGLDSRHLLEIVLESSPQSYLIPAHIWTPWFAVLGSKSGFDTVEDCYGDLTKHIFALETGLSSDPPMNWRLSQLDRFTLVSNSDAHSPPKIGREACAFACDLSYFAMKQALETRDGYAGTVEFFPEEGKYHLDGHRACGVKLTPPETKQLDLRCPTCKKELTVGVMHRVDDLADRPEGFVPIEPQPTSRNLVPLPEVIGEIKGMGESSKAVQAAYDQTLAKVGSELFILDQAPPEELRRLGSPILADAIERMRSGKVIRDAGYDGEYGVIKVFHPGELANRGRKSLLFEEVESPESKVESARPKAVSRKPKAVVPTPAGPKIASSPNSRSIT
jgi:DNA helicase-2/ATP-dependent DNA helicase PcrA